MYLCGPGKHNCQPFCGPEGRFYCSDSVCFLWPAPFSYLCVSVRILCVCWKLSAAEQVKTDCCHTPAVVSTLLTPLPVSCPLTTPHHYNCTMIYLFNVNHATALCQNSPTPLHEVCLRITTGPAQTAMCMGTFRCHLHCSLHYMADIHMCRILYCK